MKKIFTTLLGAFCVVAAMAIPAKRTPITVMQPDGKQLTVLLNGDEWSHFYTTLDGYPLVKNAKGAFVYATGVNHTLVSQAPLQGGDILAHDAAHRDAGERKLLRSIDAAALKKHIGTLAAERTAERNKARAQRAHRHAAPGRHAAPATSTIGSGVQIKGQKRGLIILAQFPDQKMRTAHSVFNDMANQKGYKGYDNYGSVHDYFYAQSYGQFDVSFDVVGPYTVSQKMAYYGGNDANGGDQHPEDLIVEACKLADGDVDFKNYDWNDDGDVDHVYVVYAGYAEAAGAAENTIWPHQWFLSSAQPSKSFQLDGMGIDSYACSSELAGTSGSKPDGIGTMCHEFSHCLGLPDFYDTSGSENENVGMSAWSLMDYGCYNGEGRTPCAYTAYERAFAGWMNLTELTSPQAVQGMKCISDAPEAYVIYNGANRSECYILDNHQEKGWDSAAAASGLLITHVDYSEQAWADNVVNNDANRLRCTVMAADGVLDKYLSTLADDLYPNSTGNEALTDTSKPAATLNTPNTDGKKLMGKPLTNITQEDGLISFDFMGGLSLPAPEGLQVTALENDGFTATWEATPKAVNYDLELLAFDLKNPFLYITSNEAFNHLTGGKDGKDGSTDIGAKLDDYFEGKGWTGEKVYTAAGKVKLGTAKAQGKLTSPLYEAPKSGQLTVFIGGENYNNKGANLTVRLLAADGTQLATITAAVASEAPALLHFDHISAPFRIEVTAATRIYLLSIASLDGRFTMDDLDEYEEAEPYTSAALQQGLTTTSHTFTQLGKGLYAVRVRANSTDDKGAVHKGVWSDMVLVSHITAVPSLPAASAQPSAIYDLSGRRVQRADKGLFIVGGRKVLK